MLTFCVAKRARVFEDHRLADIAVRMIKNLRDAGWYWLYAYCVMPDHVHVVLRLRAADRHLSRIVATMKSVIVIAARDISRTVRWQRGYHDRIVRDYEDSSEVVRYVLQNPERAGLVQQGVPYAFAGVIDSYQ